MTAPLHIASFFVALARSLAGDDPTALDHAIDQAAHQKYASVSGLYWHTDLRSAQAVAKSEGKPILHLRLLGRLDEDLSCANSRLFRTTLYANVELAAFLRESFVLYWSSERPAPRMTIDFGDGRTIVTTTTGNSAHYVMDDEGRVLDVLPGLYAPAAFRTELEGSLALATEVRGLADAARAHSIVAYHQREAADAQRALASLESVPVFGGSNVELSQRMTISKAAIEVRPLRTLGAELSASAYSPDAVALWQTAGTRVFGLAPDKALDEQSRELVVRVHDGELPAEMRANDAQRAALLGQVASHVIADSALNQLILRPQISREIVRRAGGAGFDALNQWVYATVFHTPASDPWFGLVPRTAFTGLPGDGVVLP